MHPNHAARIVPVIVAALALCGISPGVTFAQLDVPATVSGEDPATNLRVLTRAAGRPSSGRLEAGDDVIISVGPAAWPPGAFARVRITSAKGRYDSSLQRMSLTSSGMLYFAWRTVGLKSSDDYLVSIELVEKVHHSVRTRVRLERRFEELPSLVTAADLRLPSRTEALQFSRRHVYHIGSPLEDGPLGFGWHLDVPSLHRDDLGLVFEVAGSWTVFAPAADGGYASIPPFAGSFRKDDDGGYTIKTDRGDGWRFRPDLTPLFYENVRSARITYEYEAGRLSRICDATGQQIELSWFDGRIAKVADSAGRVVQYSYRDGNLSAVVPSSGVRSTFEYDADHRLTAASAPDSGTTRFTYGIDGRLTVIKPEGMLGLRLSYDTSTAEQSIDFGDGTKISQRVAADGRPEVFTDALGARLIADYDPATQAMSHLTDPNGHGWAYYGGANRYTVQDPMGHRVVATYGENRLLESLIDENEHQRRITYDQQGRITATYFPDGTNEVYKSDSDADGSLTVRRTSRGGHTIVYRFNPRGLLIARDVQGGPAARFTWDLAGHLTMAEENGRRLTFEYDERGNLVCAVNVDGRAFRYRYDEASRPVEMTDPTGRTLRYLYDRSGRLLEIRDVRTGSVAAYTYDERGRLKRRTLGNGVTTTIEYDGAARIIRMLTRTKSGATISDRKYERDRAGYTIRRTNNAGVEIYKYDAISQLIGANYANGTSEAFRLDPAGNRLEVKNTEASTAGSLATRTTSYAVDSANKYVTVGGAPVTHDGDGNLASVAGTTMQHDALGRLVEVVTHTGRTVTFEYDPIGRLISRTDQEGNTTRFSWDGDNIVLAEENGSRLSYTWGAPDELLAGDREGGRLYFDQDANRAVDVVLNTSGRVVDRYRFKAFGDVLHGAASDTAIHWSAAFYDSASGLYYMRARWYSPSLGRFLEPDPAGLSGGIHEYKYAENSPIDLSDPSGLGLFKKITHAIKSFGQALTRNPIQTILKTTVLVAVAPALVNTWSTAIATAAVAVHSPVMAPVAAIEGYAAYRLTNMWLNEWSKFGDQSQAGLASTVAGICAMDPSKCLTPFASAGLGAGTPLVGAGLGPDIQLAPVPEPATLLLMGTGLAAIARLIRRRS